MATKNVRYFVNFVHPAFCPEILQSWDHYFKRVDVSSEIYESFSETICPTSYVYIYYF